VAKAATTSPATQHNFDLRAAFSNDADRFGDLSIEAPYMRADLSKQLWTKDIRQALFDLADALDFPAWRARLLGGAQLNTTEQRSVDHAVWRLDAATRPAPAC